MADAPMLDDSERRSGVFFVHPELPQ